MVEGPVHGLGAAGMLGTAVRLLAAPGRCQTRCLHRIVQLLAVAQHLLLIVVVQRVRLLVSKQSFN